MKGDFVGDALAWLITFAVHSSLLIGLGAVLARECHRRGAVSCEEAVWRVSVFGGLATATLQALAGDAWLPPPTAVHALIRGLPGISGGSLTLGGALSGPLWPRILILLALVASTIRFAVWSAGRFRLASFLTRRYAAPDPAREMLEDLVSAAGGGMRPKLSLHPGLQSPVAFGVVRPEIAIPAQALRAGPDSLRPMLAHELAHLLGRDPLWRALLDMTEVLFPWQVLLRPVRRRMELLSEFRCDSQAAQWTCAEATARSLVTAAGWIPPPAGRLILLDGLVLSGFLEKRVERLLRGSHHWSGAGGGFVAVLLLSLGALAPVLPGVTSGRLGSASPPSAQVVPDSPLKAEEFGPVGKLGARQHQDPALCPGLRPDPDSAPCCGSTGGFGDFAKGRRNHRKT